jgi:hypothetical protein
VIFLAYSLCVQPPALDPVEYERRAVEARERIRTWHYAAAVTHERFATGGQKSSRQGARFEVWADATRYRADETAVGQWPARSQVQLPSAEAGRQPTVLATARTTVCRGCRADGAYLRLIHPGTPATFYQPTAEEVDRFERDRLDPRGLGHGAGKGLNPPPPRGNLVDPGVRYISAEPTGDAGEVLVRGTYIKTGSQHRCWVAPDKGYGVTRFELSGPPDAAGKEEPGLVVENELALDTPSGVWFPKRTRVRTYLKGELASERQITVEVAEFNRPLDPAAFTLAGLRLSPGTPVRDDIAKTLDVWDGSKRATSFSGPVPPEVRVVMTALPSSQGPGASPAAQSADDPTRTSWQAYALAGVLAAVGSTLVLYARRR